MDTQRIAIAHWREVYINMSLLLPGNSQYETINKMNSVNCPMCYYVYSVAEKRRPHILTCGHSVCNTCLQTHSVCGTCNLEYAPGDYPINYNLCDAVGEMTEMFDVFKAQCSKCSSLATIEKARICKTCLKTSGLYGNDDVADEAKMAPFLFCPSCAIDEHIDIGHEVTKYFRLKNRVLLNMSSDEARKEVNGIAELCASEWENGRNLLEDWRKALTRAVEMGSDINLMTCEQLAENFTQSAKTIYEAIDVTLLPTLRAFSQAVKKTTEGLKSNTPAVLFGEHGEFVVDPQTEADAKKAQDAVKQPAAKDVQPAKELCKEQAKPRDDQQKLPPVPATANNSANANAPPKDAGKPSAATVVNPVAGAGPSKQDAKPDNVQQNVPPLVANSSANAPTKEAGIAGKEPAARNVQPAAGPSKEGPQSDKQEAPPVKPEHAKASA